MLVAKPGHGPVSGPSVGSDHGPRFNRLLDCLVQLDGASILDLPQANTADAVVLLLCRDEDQRLVSRPAAPLTGFRAAEEGLIHFEDAVEPILVRSHHRPAELVEPIPCRLVAAQPEGTLDAGRARSVLLRGDHPHDLEPLLERLVGVLEEGARRQADVMLVRLAEEDATTGGPELVSAADGTGESVGPADAKEVFPAPRLSPEPVIELGQSFRILFHNQRVSW